MEDSLNLMLLVVRVAAGITLALHGYQKLFLGGRIPGTARWFESLGMRPGKLHAYLAATTEIVSGVLFALGLLTSFAAAGCVGVMVVAAWTHKDKFFVFQDGWEYNLVLALLYVLVAVTGPGRFSLDRLLDIDGDLDDSMGIIIPGLGFVAAVLLLAVFWRPAREESSAS